MPASIRKIVKFLKFDLLYKQLYIDRKTRKTFNKNIEIQKELYNFPDAHVNYIEEAYSIYGSYGVPKEKIFITYNSPDTDLLFGIKEDIKNEELILPQNNFRIIHLSRLVAWKRVDMLITAVKNLKKEYPQIELLVVGEGPDKEKLMELSLTLGVRDSVNFLGGIYDPATLGKYLMSSSMYTLAGMGGLSINDAMIFGLPVVCSVCDGTEKHLVREGYNGLYFENGNQCSLESKIKYLFDHPEERIEMGKNSVQIINDEINIHTVVDGYIRAFNYVLNKN
jgi:glycosyltransferase involved in cell wall biosynthesis